MKRLSALLVAVLLGVTASVAHAGKGVHESPVVDLGASAEVLDSEAKIERDGTYKVEVPEAAAGSYKLCVFYNSSSTWLNTLDLTEPGELKFEGDLGAGTLVAPHFIIYTGGNAGGCDGDAVYQSGVTLI